MFISSPSTDRVLVWVSISVHVRVFWWCVLTVGVEGWRDLAVDGEGLSIHASDVEALHGAVPECGLSVEQHSHAVL